ncbi:sulfate adenylyltransferase subunit CysN [Methylococcaceae bacterium HT1]|nr:sulfate adenylyltransferase subunit CysN [Methylococcaceae bacterium HT1]TXL21821.1 sulfate adenylyltransferase subunit CysN [Methylococcaceae bacterium HT2]
MSHQSDLISTDIDAYLAQHERKELLRFLTCGNVDDGKSTLIGRLLYDSKMIYEDQLAAVRSDSIKSGATGAGKIDLALLVDGLQAEREQGITIDVAYRYFSTTNRKFIIADTPGHEQYTRNMATGASTCDLAVILIDARYGVQTQTKRHSFIASLLGIKHIIVAINKMDLMDYSEDTYEKIKADYLDFISNLDGLNDDVHVIPLSALDGDNVVNKSSNMPWYSGKSMMETLETVEISEDGNFQDARFPVQYVNRPNLDFRGFCGTIASGMFRKGDAITTLPSGKTSTIKSIVTFDGELEEAYPPMAITLTLDDEIDVSRGDTIVKSDNLPSVADKFDANIVWMTENALVPGKQYIIKLATRSVSGSIASIQHRIDVNTLKHHDANELQLNEIGLCSVSVNAPVVFDAYTRSKGTGSFIIIDRLTNVTVGAGMISGHSSDTELNDVSTEERAARFGQKAVAIALSGTHSEQTAYQLERKLFDNGHAATVLTGTLSNIDEAIAVVKHAGLICLCTSNNACDFSFDTDKQSLEQIHLALKEQKIIQ